MSPEQIAELYIQAAEVDRRLPQTAKPARLKAMNHGYFHTWEDVKGWSGERVEQERADFFDAKSTRLTRNEIGIWEVSMELIKLVRKAENRRALFAWASSKAGGMSLPKWCREIERQTTGKGIHPETARRRAKAAISEIASAFASKPLLHMQNDDFDVLPDTPEISDKLGTLRVWRPDEAKPTACSFDADLMDFSWADMQNARRRERRARAAKAA